MRIRFAWLVLPALFVLVGVGCDRNPEHRAAIENLNNHPEIIERGGVVKELEFREEQRGGVFPFRGDILDAQGNVIGNVNGARVEGFGTRVNRIRWNDGSGDRPQRGDGRGRWQGRQRPAEQDAAPEGGGES
jgi:hypothetical protein